jgi:hypothetical protein
MFQNVLRDPTISKEKQICLFFQCLLESLCPFIKYLHHCVFLISYTCLHVISYKRKYVLFHLNMLKLFKRLTCFFFEIKLFFNKKISLKYLIERFNPHLLS